MVFVYDIDGIHALLKSDFATYQDMVSYRNSQMSNEYKYIVLLEGWFTERQARAKIKKFTETLPEFEEYYESRRSQAS